MCLGNNDNPMARINSSLNDAANLGHHSEPGDPLLLEWIRHRVDDFVGLEPWVIVLVSGFVVIAIPVIVMTVFLLQRPWRRRP